MLPTYPLTYSSGQSDSNALTNSTTATTILPQTALCTIPAGTLQIGSTIKTTVRGRISTVVTTPGTITFAHMMGGVAASAYGACALNVNAQTNASFELILISTLRQIGPATNVALFISTATFTSRAVIGSAAAGVGGAGVLVLPDTAITTGGNINVNIAFTVDVFATWSVLSASNSIQVHQAFTELKV